MLRAVASSLPSFLVRWLNTAQFRYPWTARPLRFLATRVVSGEGVIGRGPGRGLRIDATGRNAGYLLGTSDREEQDWLVKNLTLGGVFYDLGANVGFFTLIGARLVGPRGRVAAFEPLPENVAQLRRNVDLNSFDHVTVVAAAVSTESGSTRFGSASGGASSRRHNSRILGPAGRSPNSVDVSLVTIDGWREETGAPPPTVMKIDVEGAEIDVLRGAERTIREHRPVILVEVHWLGELFVSYVEEFVLPLGYAAETIDGRAIPIAAVRCHAVLRPITG